MTWGELLYKGKKQLLDAGVPDAENDAWYLFQKAFGMTRSQYLLCMTENAETERTGEYEALLKRREKREPLQHILGNWDFMGLSFEVNGDVLVPRQDTEVLVEAVLSRFQGQDPAMLDLCTGSGCIAVSLAALGNFSRVWAADLSEKALAVAKRNAERILSGKDAGVVFRRSDMFSAFHDGEKFDLITSNPPYIPTAVIEELEPEVRDFEPRMALDGAEDGLFFYRILAEQSGRFLNPGGAVFFEIGHDQGAAVSGLLEENGFTDVELCRDLTGKDRVVCGRWRND